MIEKNRALGEILLPREQIRSRVTELGRQISTDYAGSKLAAIVTLRGSFIFAADLVRQLSPKLSVQVDFLAASSYGNQTTSSGRLDISQDFQADLAGRPVLIIEDIVDTGETLKAIRDLVLVRQPRSVEIVTLLRKDHKQIRDLPIKYIGFSVPDVFVVGYGLDFAQMYRHLADIRILEYTTAASD